VFNGLSRPTEGRWIAGVCAGIARRFGIGASTVRLLAVIAVVFLGLSIWAYLLLWLLMPSDPV